jgi:hypothetical protein
MEQDMTKTTLSIAAISNLQRGNKIEAIKLIRKESGVSLKEAKNIAEDYLRAHPSAQASLKEMQTPIWSKVMWSVIGIIAGAILAYVFHAKK